MPSLVIAHGLRGVVLCADDEEDALPAGDPEADSDDGALAAVLDNARKLSGRRAERRERFREEGDDESEEEGGEVDAAAAKYGDWFDAPAEGRGELNGADDMQNGERPASCLLPCCALGSASGSHARYFSERVCAHWKFIGG